MRVRIAELEQQQVENEEKIAAMVIQAQEYASRLEQAQNTIHNLSEPKLLEDDELLSFHSGFHPLSVSSQEGAKETEITKVKLAAIVNASNSCMFTVGSSVLSRV